MDLNEQCFTAPGAARDPRHWSTADHLIYNTRLIQYTLMQAHADGRPLSTLFGNREWTANVCARFAIYEGKSGDPEWQALLTKISI